MFSLGEKKSEAAYFQKEFLRSLSVGRYNKNNQYLFIQSADVDYYNAVTPQGIKLSKSIYNNRRRSPREALKHAYIQPNTKYNLSNIVIDIDRENFSFSDFEDLNLPLPNILVMNTRNNKCHAWYMLARPVWLQNEYRSKADKITAYEYAEAVYSVLCERLKADKHFNRALCKNPFYECDSWKTIFLTDHKYTLGEIASSFDPEELNAAGKVKRPAAADKKEPLQLLLDLPDFDLEIFEGSRNQTLFDEARKQAYIYFRDTKCSESDLYNFCLEVLEKLNKDCLDKSGRISCPLSDRELSGIAKSISSWCCSKKFNEGLLSKYTDEQRAYALEVRRRNKAKNLNVIRKAAAKNPTLSNRAISSILTKKAGKGFSTWSINQAMKQIEREREIVREYKERKEAAAKARLDSDFMALSDPAINKGESFLSVCNGRRPFLKKTNGAESLPPGS